jgi:hypothetical protein
MVLPTNSATVRSAPLSIARTTSWSGGVPAISFVEFSGPVDRICAGVRDPRTGYLAIGCQPFHSSDLLWCYSSINLTLPRHGETQSSAGSHIFFSKQRTLYATYACGLLGHDRL